MSLSNEKERVEIAANAAALANAVGEEMLARLAWVTLQPAVILDVGCGAGYCSGLLQARYPTATILSLDADYPMLKYAEIQAGNDSVQLVCADAESLPLPDQSVDLVFANLVLPWVQNSEKMLREWRRVLRPEGLLVFTSLGPDTLQAWRSLLGDFTIPNFIDMHEIGDMLTRTRFADPVMDVEYFTLTYRTLAAVLLELQASGVLVAGCHVDEAAVQWTEAGRLAATYEVVYGHAWGPDAMVDQVADEFGTVRIPLGHLRRR